MDLSKTYNPKEFEDEIYRRWEEGGYFKAEVNHKKKPFTIVIPPPNITGQLHMGHALDDTMQDAMIRYKRMKGYEALWVPGTDHASIATEVKIVEQMQKEGLTKQDVGREGFLERAFAWKEKYGGRIIEQLKKMGFSCDWSRLAFTMDERCSKAVKHVFVKLYDKKLIYRGDRIINWCPSCKTAISDAEVDYVEEDSHLWHVRYDVKGSDKSVTVATTRPETMFGDTAVAVNPKDERYRDLIGKTLILPIVNKEIPIVADEYVDMAFGTGAVKITPAHDPNDFEVGLRHKLDVIRVMNDDGSMNELAGEFCGLDRYEARARVVEKLKKLGNLAEIEAHKHNVGHCYRCGTSIEPIVSKQWFVKMQPLADPAIQAVKEGKTKFVPKRFEKVYFNWMENIKDWCISRQLWWGHRIPAYYCAQCGETVVTEGNPPKKCKCGGQRFVQDEAVLDTWFSSALWPFSTLGYPDQTEDLKYFYPTDVLITAYDIIFFWVARMIFSGIEHMGEVPFKDVLIHGLVRDSEGRKMSKSLGNGVDPLEIIEKYGADTLRFYLMFGVSPGGDTRFIEEKLEGMKCFMNKIWNASRFVLMNLEGNRTKDVSKARLSLASKWILHKLNDTVRDVTKNIEKYEFGNAVSKLYDFIWNDFCDWYIELIKPVLYNGSDGEKTDELSVLKYVFETILKLLHPFTPFITERLYQEAQPEKKTIMIESYPEYCKQFVFEAEFQEMSAVMELIEKIRQVRREMSVPPSKPVPLYIKPIAGVDFMQAESYLKKLGALSDVTIIKDKREAGEKTVTIVTSGGECYIPMGELVDIGKEIERLGAERKKYEEELGRARGKLNNKGFVEKAPKQLIEAENAKIDKYQALIQNIDALLADLKR